MTRRKFITAATLALALVAGLIPGALAPASGATAIQPGARISSDGNGCTMNFIYRELLPEQEATAEEDEVTFGEEADGDGEDADSSGSESTGSEDVFVEQPEPRLFAGTAGHCVERVGARVANNDGDFGTVAFRVLTEDGNVFDDVAFIEIDRDKEHLVNPKMLGFSGPNGFISGTEADSGDAVHVYGNGLIFGETELTRPRSGSLTYGDRNYYGATLPVIFGDSGGPVLHESGAALGIVAHVVVGFDFTTLNGNTVERALELARQSGLELELVPAT